MFCSDPGILLLFLTNSYFSGWRNVLHRNIQRRRQKKSKRCSPIPQSHSHFCPVSTVAFQNVKSSNGKALSCLFPEVAVLEKLVEWKIRRSIQLCVFDPWNVKSVVDKKIVQLVH